MQALQTQVRNSLDWQTQSETSLWLTPQLTQGLRRLITQNSVYQKEGLNNTQEGLNETVRIQREHSINNHSRTEGIHSHTQLNSRRSTQLTKVRPTTDYHTSIKHKMLYWPTMYAQLKLITKAQLQMIDELLLTKTLTQLTYSNHQPTQLIDNR